jgi:hypothetical protein
MLMPPAVLVLALEQRMVLLAARRDVRDQVQHLVARQAIGRVRYRATAGLGGYT